ncbi:MAG: HAD family acid phosphatase [Myxococcota bacterium]
MLRTALFLALVGCPKPPPVETAVPPAPIPRDDVMAVVWTQTSAENDAVALTVFRSARMALDLALADPTWTAAVEQTGELAGLVPAIVVDVDETVLDNSPYQARLVRDGGHFEKATWGAWVDEAAAKPIPGAAAFLSDAKARGVDVFYVSNRDVSQEEATRANLAALGFPDAETLEHLRFRPADGDRSKTARRLEIEKTHRIVMMFGDNLFDFMEAEAPDLPARDGIVTDHAEWWGTRWFMLPNPMYGSWDDAVLSYTHPDASAAHEARVEALDPAR